MTGNFWDDASYDVIHKTINELYTGREEKSVSEYQRYRDYYDARPIVLNNTTYFPRRHRETSERYEDRPRHSWPLARTIADVHAEALVPEPIDIEILADDAGKTQLTWNDIDINNSFSGAYVKKLSTYVSVFGSVFVKNYLYDDGTPEKSLEFEAYPPDICQPIYEANAEGRSVKRMLGCVITTGYSLETGMVVDWPQTAEAIEALNIKKRVEFITPKQWIVFLDGKPTPVSPQGVRWMPRNDGKNPWGIMPALVNGMETHESFLGQSDIRQTVYDTQIVNEVFSDIIYTMHLCVPVPVLESNNDDAHGEFKMGLGAGFGLYVGDRFYWANPNINFQQLLEPLRVCLELTYSNGNVPSAAVGLGHLFKHQMISGVAKEYEYKPTIERAKAKRPSFSRGIEECVRNALTIAWDSQKVIRMDDEGDQGVSQIGQGKPVAEDYLINIEYPGDIVPSSKLDELDRYTKEAIAGLRSTFGAMMQYHGWDEERAAKEMDHIAAEQKRHLVEIGYKDIVDIIDKRQSASITVEEEKEAEEALFSASGGTMEADQRAEQPNLTVVDGEK